MDSRSVFLSTHERRQDRVEVVDRQETSGVGTEIHTAVMMGGQHILKGRSCAQLPAAVSQDPCIPEMPVHARRAKDNQTYPRYPRGCRDRWMVREEP